MAEDFHPLFAGLLGRLSSLLFPNVTLSVAKGLPGWGLADSSSAYGAPQNDRCWMQCRFLIKLAVDDFTSEP